MLLWEQTHVRLITRTYNQNLIMFSESFYSHEGFASKYSLIINLEVFQRLSTTLFCTIPQRSVQSRAISLANMLAISCEICRTVIKNNITWKANYCCSCWTLPLWTKLSSNMQNSSGGLGLLSCIKTASEQARDEGIPQPPFRFMDTF